MKCSSSSSRAGVFLALQASQNDNNKMFWRKKEKLYLEAKKPFLTARRPSLPLACDSVILKQFYFSFQKKYWVGSCKRKSKHHFPSLLIYFVTFIDQTAFLFSVWDCFCCVEKGLAFPWQYRLDKLVQRSSDFGNLTANAKPYIN